MNTIINTNTNFSGIKLTHSDPFSTRVIARQLKNSGFFCFGKKTYDVVNFSDKRFVFDDIRLRNDFSMRNFGVIFLPKEAYIVAAPRIEQFMLPIIKKIDKGAKINLLL